MLMLFGGLSYFNWCWLFNALWVKRFIPMDLDMHCKLKIDRTTWEIECVGLESFLFSCLLCSVLFTFEFVWSFIIPLNWFFALKTLLDSSNWFLWDHQVRHATLCCCRWGMFILLLWCIPAVLLLLSYLMKADLMSVKKNGCDFIFC